MLMPYIYSPLGAALEWEVWIALFPLSVVTGIAMWQQAKLRKVLAKGGFR
jgi:thiosulfate reductase cytochrome b subunit